MLPQKIFETACSKIASEAILGRNPRRSNYMAHGVLYPLFGCSCMHVLFLISTRQGTKVGRTAVGVASLRRHLVNS